MKTGLEIYIQENAIKSKVKEIAQKISNDYKDSELILICVLKGSCIFMADLVREISIPIFLDFMSVSSYGSSTSSSGKVRIIKDIENDIEGKHVLIVEDIIDSGLTLVHLRDLLYTRGPKSVKTVTIFDKPSRRVVDINSDYRGFEIENHFVVGYGLDYKEKYRNLKDLCILSFYD